MNDTLLESVSWARLLIPSVLLMGFLLGSIPFGLILARVFHVKNLMEKGSGNIGATNVSRIVGFWPAGVLTFSLDFSKGYLAVYLGTPAGAQWISSLMGMGDSVVDHLPLTLAWATGFAVVLGHCFSPFLNFKGGKGVSTSFGVLCFLSPAAAAFGVIGFVVTYFYRRIVSLASLAALGSATAGYLVLNPIGGHLWFGAALCLLVMIRHEKNIDALLENREKAFH